MAKFKLFAVLSLLTFAAAPAVFASEYGSVSSDASKNGKTMEEFVKDAETGFDEPFSEEEVQAVMAASRHFKKEDRQFSRKLERIASKMANLR